MSGRPPKTPSQPTPARKPRPDRGSEAASSHSIKRSPHWSAVRDAYIDANPLCAACGPELDTRDHNEVHHVIPFHLCVLLAGRIWSSTLAT